MGKPIHLETVLRDALAASTAKAQALEKAIRETQNLTPGPAPQASVRRDLLLQIEELEGTLNYMGEGHPRRRNDVMRLAQLKILLTRWEQTLEVQQKWPKIRKR
jgi:hypothetical protein